MTKKKPAARLDRAGIGTAYGLNERTVDAWTRLLNFPAPVADGQWDAGEVDQWFQTSRPQFWPAKKAVPEPAPESAVASSPADADQPTAETSAEELLGMTGLALRYKVGQSTVASWRKATGARAFPAETEPGSRRWRAGKVDAWVKKHRAHVWAEITGAGPKVVIAPPEGDPKDLYDIGSYGVILGNATRGRPLPRSTMLNYKSQGHLEPPDRKPGDNKQPEVFEPMWYLETISDHVYSRRGRGRLRVGRTRRTGKGN